MSLAWIASIKNDNGEWHFTVPLSLPPITTIQAGTNSYSFGGYRQASSEEESSSNFLLGRAACKKMMEDAAADPLIWDGIASGSLDKWVYGKANGQAVHFNMPRVGTVFKNFNLTKYLSFLNYYSYQPAFSSGSVDNGGNYYYSTAGLALLYDDTLNVIAPCFVSGSCSWDRNNHTPAYYDSATFSIYVFAGTAVSDYTYKNNYYPFLFTSIPSGGGGSDPYEAGGYSDTTPSSSGDFDDASDSISIPSLPSISAMGAGAVSLAVIDEANLGTFMNYILSPSFAGLSNISRFFSDPIKAIACLNYMPYTPTNTSGFTLSWGGDDTGASVGAVSAQYEEIDCGSVDLTEFYGSCLDYSPYTTVQLVLPFAGSVDIDPDEFNGKTISVKYHIDNYTGAGLVLVSDGDRVLLQVPCSVSNPIPLTSTDYSAIISAIANVVMGGVSTIAAVYTGGASVGASIAMVGGFAASAAGNVMSAKLHYNHGGSMGMGTGMFGVLKPYLIIKRPRQCLPERNGNYQGYPTFVTENLGDLSGFTKIAEIHLDSIPVTTEERSELLAILKGGVIF